MVRGSKIFVKRNGCRSWKPPPLETSHARTPSSPARLHVRVLMREWALVGWHFRREGRQRVRGERGPAAAAQAYNTLNDVLPLDVVGSISF